MMILKVIDERLDVLESIAKLLVEDKLIACATIDSPSIYYEANAAGVTMKTEKYVMSGISKSLLFKKINDVLRDIYKEDTPLLYSEPIIMLDPEHTEAMISKLIKA